MVAHTRRTVIKTNHNHSQTADPGKNPTVILTYSFVNEKKFEFLPLFSENFPALKKFLATSLDWAFKNL